MVLTNPVFFSPHPPTHAHFPSTEVGMIMIEVSETEETAKEVDEILTSSGFIRDPNFKSWNNLNALYLNKNVYRS